MNIVVGITGASGAIYGIRLIEKLKEAGCIVHAVVTDSGWKVLDYECQLSRTDVEARVDMLHDVRNIEAAIASGSFKTDAMVVVPCSMKTLGSIAHAISDNLLTRAADVTMKEGRKLIIVPRETPVHAIHLENMLKLAQNSVTIIPASPGFYHRPQTVMNLVDILVGKIMDNLHIENNLFARWQGKE